MTVALEATKAARAAINEAAASGDKKAEEAARNGMDEAAMTNLEAIIADLESLTDFYRETENVESDLTPEERRRLIGARVRNNSFIDKAFDLALANPQFLPKFLTPDRMLAIMRRFEDSRQIMILAHQFARVATDRFMLESNIAYHAALRFYGSLREMSRAGISGARDLFDELLNYFRHRRRPRGQPTEHEIEADFHKLLHGKADGELVIENEMPHTSGGQHEVIDTIHSGHTAVDEQVDVSENRHP